MPRNPIIPYDSDLRDKARMLRYNSTLSEVLLWKKIKRNALGIQFHRQVPILHYIVDFYCHELFLAIEIDGSSHDGKFLYDAKREAMIESKGIKVIYFDDVDVKNNISEIIRQLEITIEERKTDVL